ncbi:ribosome maturation factor RimP [Anaerococcus sp. AGMB00486]|uniref:Ribosome maturation factor RimP n=1 Tax=Anaerococcus faecalis TaxID=2742993 RepID=A0ABX2N8C3_9FIRM|nr:ribosome maturation factor RimP [Anaerococcus faecalis]NVF10952.1 ribosome maturation factor RimP [Anaerococcus faecalis]
MDLISRLKENLETDINNLGYELVDCEFVSEGKNKILRFFIYKEGGVTIDDCEKVSNFLNEKLDELDLIKSFYYLEVSSPDLSRPLKTDRDLERNKDELLNLKLKNGDVILCHIKEIKDDYLLLDKEGEDFKIAKSDIKTIKIEIVF